MDIASTLAPLIDHINITLIEPHASNETHHDAVSPARRYIKLLVKIVYVMGILGNATAIIVLRKGERRVRNRKHLLLLTSLAANDLVALVGMLLMMAASEHVPGAASSRVLCAGRVALRVFGIGSVCIAVTMALERCLALTKPFLYQKQVTYYVIRMALLASWFWAAILTCAPILGVGLYYDEKIRQCTRYRNALSGLDFGYAVFYVMFGTFLCLILVYCNMAVIRALYATTDPRCKTVVRRVSKSSCRQRRDEGTHHNAATAEEVAFSRLMATLSVLFMICWLPQMLTSVLYLSLGPTAWPRLVSLSTLSDVLMLLNYVLNPILYVLMRLQRLSMSRLCRSVATCFKRNHQSTTSTDSVKTCCVQETLVSDSSAEMRPLRNEPPCAIVVKIDD